MMRYPVSRKGIKTEEQVKKIVDKLNQTFKRQYALDNKFLQDCGIEPVVFQVKSDPGCVSVRIKAEEETK